LQGSLIKRWRKTRWSNRGGLVGQSRVPSLWLFPSERGMEDMSRRRYYVMIMADFHP
jgi:hypothetical protein